MINELTPPQWHLDAWCKQALAMGADVDAVFLEAARWGADQELQACINWLYENDWKAVHKHLRAARRPKPPSLKERALQAWAAVDAGTDDQAAMSVIRRALEQLDD
jgi:hypothetical protein